MNRQASSLKKHHLTALAVLLGCALWGTAQAGEEFYLLKTAIPIA